MNSPRTLRNNGSLTAPDGTLDVTWTVAGDDASRRLCFQWREAGGPPVAEPRHRGFGVRLAERSVTRALNGALDIAFDPRGVRCTMDIPLPVAA